MQQWNTILVRLFLVALAARGVVAHASDASRLYAPCVVCHQPSAGGSPDGAIPNLAGQKQWYLKKQLLLFRTGARTDSAMNVIAVHPGSDNAQSNKLLAAYLAALDANPNPVEGAGDHLRLGQETFTYICAACHGADGGGSPDSGAPRIGKQHYPYVRRQIEAAATLHKDVAPPEMTSALAGMSSQQKDAVADYVSRLGSSNVLLDLNRFNDRQR